MWRGLTWDRIPPSEGRLARLHGAGEARRERTGPVPRAPSAVGVGWGGVGECREGSHAPGPGLTLTHLGVGGGGTPSCPTLSSRMAAPFLVHRSSLKIMVLKT